MSSSLRNAVKRITHKERAQPRSRSRLGLLEKHKDYKVRARDHHAKADRLTRMRRKAAERNPDEFYFGMHKNRVDSAGDGLHRLTDEAQREKLKDVIGFDAVRIMKDQDTSYVRMCIQKDTKKVEQLESGLHLIGVDVDGKSSKSGGKHTIFVNNSTEAKRFDAAKHFDTAEELVARTFHRPRLSTLLQNAEQQQQQEQESDDDDDEDNDEHAPKKKQRRLTPKQIEKQNKELVRTMRRAAKARSSAYKELEARRTRKKKLELAEAHLVTEKLMHTKGRKRKIKEAKDGRPAVFQWRRRRAG